MFFSENAFTYVCMYVHMYVCMDVHTYYILCKAFGTCTGENLDVDIIRIWILYCTYVYVYVYDSTGAKIARTV